MGEATSYNSLGDRLRVERQSLYQRELMLDTVIQTTPLALVLTNEGDAVLYSNTAARQLFGAGRKLEGERFARYLEAAPVPLREAIERGGDTLFTLELGGEPRCITCRNGNSCSTPCRTGCCCSSSSRARSIHRKSRPGKK
jgi:PAS domain-containing protein